MAGVGVAELHGDLGDLHLALLQKRRGMPGEDAVHHRFEGGVVDAQIALQGPAGQVHFPGYPVNARLRHGGESQRFGSGRDPECSRSASVSLSVVGGRAAVLRGAS
jgi:hypothetical protein